MPQPEKIGKYEVLHKIGEGGGGAVYQALDPQLKREVAIKLCLVEDADLARRFAREAEIAARLSHQNIVVVYDFGFVGDRPYLVQELLGGEDLVEIIHRRHSLSQKKRLGCLAQVARALAFAHSEGVIHRDVKPSNVRVLDDGRIKVLDFGIARLLDASTKLTRAGTTLGTAGYLAPEQIRGEEVDFRADVFSFGVLAYELLAYERPYKATQVADLFRMVLEEEAPPIRMLYPEIPRAIDSWIAKCMRRSRRERWVNFEALLPEIEASELDSEDSSENVAVPIHEPTLTEATWPVGSEPGRDSRPQPTSSKHPRLGRWLIFLLLAASGGLAYWIWSLQIR